MKRVLCWGVVLSLILCSCSSVADGGQNSKGEDNTTIRVEKEIFDVTLNIPADFIDDETTQESLDLAVSEKGYQSAMLNDDGSVTYVISKTQHKEMMEELETSIKDGLGEMVNSEEYPNLVSIDTNNDYTEFTVVTENETPDFAEMLSTMIFYMYGGMYNAFNGSKADNISVKFVNESSGNVVKEANSRDAK